MKTMLLATITILLTFREVQCQSCEHYESFRYDKYNPVWPYAWYNYVICSNLTLKEETALTLSYGGTHSTKYIIFKNCNMPIIPAGKFSRIGDTNEVYLNDSRINSINRGAFIGMFQVQKLFLQNNNISNLVEGTLYYLNSLKVLDLSNNSLVKFGNHSFSGLTQLETLNLAKNHIYELSNCVFCPLRSLKTLDLSYNWIYNIAGNSFANLFNLEKLLLNNNFLEYLPKSLLANTTMLNTLDVSVNKIPNFNFNDLPAYLKCLNISYNSFKDMNDWSWLNKLEIIDLGMNDFSYLSGIGRGIISLYFSGNYLETLDSSIFNQPEDLIYLDLCNNSVEEIEANTFDYSLAKLEKLNLSRNQIQYLPVGCFKHLVSLWELRLSHNYLTNLEYGTFAGLDNLTVLFLDNNNLKVIHENSFYVLRNLKALYLTNNAIVSLDIGEILVHLPKINTIGLNSNNWNCKSLFTILEILTHYHVGFFNGTDDRTENINGIACKSTDKQNSVETIDGETGKSQFGYLQNNVETIVREQFPINSTLHKFFESAYTNSSFFNYFEKGFKKTNFFKYFNKDFFNSSFFRYFDSDFKNSGFFKELNKQTANNVNSDDSNESDFEEDDATTTESSAEGWFAGSSSSSWFGESSAEALEQKQEFHGEQSADEELVIFVNKITICVIINVAVLMVMILLFLFVLFRKQQKLKFMKSQNECPQNDALL